MAEDPTQLKTHLTPDPVAEGFGGASVAGPLYASPAVGMFAATLTSGWARRVNRHGLTVAVAAGSRASRW